MAPVDGGYHRLRRGSLVALLWAGLLLCILAIARYWDESRDLIQSLSGSNSLLLVVALVAVWALAVASWKQVIHAYSSDPVTTAIASRHLALLLLGKYLPGGIWGFVARLTDSSEQRPMASMFAAGIAEQWFGLVAMALLAGLGTLAARAQHLAWLWAVVLIPAVAMVSLALLHQSLQLISRILPPRWQQIQALAIRITPNRALWKAASLTLLQQGLILGVVAGIASPAFALDAPAALAVASSYGLAVVAGVLVVIMPGGILVREAVFVALSSRWLQPPQAIALAAGLRLVFTAFDLLAGLLAGGLRIRRAWRE